MSGVIVVGIQWGDEGKGKVVDLLAERADVVVRSQGGNNAGHTVVAAGQEYRLHLVPSGIFYPHTRCYITGGTAIDPAVLLEEIEGFESRGIVLKGRLQISPYAHLIFPYHRTVDRLQEEGKGKGAIGTTGRGVGPCYVDRVQRIGIRVGELVRPDLLRQRLLEVTVLKNRELQQLFASPPLSADQLYSQYVGYGEKLAPYVGAAELEIAQALKEKKKVLFEGAHGTFLDINFGTYPYVTSSSTLAGGICAGGGIGPSRIGKTIGVVKAYTTRVGNGPLPTALKAEEGKYFLSPQEAREIGTTTGRERRLAWFDGPLARLGVQLNGVDQLAVTKLDVLDSLPEIKVCTDYRYAGQMTNHFPPLVEDLGKVEPVYKTIPGWRCSTKEARTMADLPAKARRYLELLEELCQAPVTAVSIGPERENTLTTPQFYAFNRH